MMGCLTYRKLGLIGILSLIFGITCLSILGTIILKIIRKETVLKYGSPSFNLWHDIPLIIYQKFYFFNVLNPKAIETLGARPILEEIGPFTYRSWYHKEPINFNPNGTVTYREIKTWKFVPELSVRPETQVITTLNTPLALAFTIIKKEPKWLADVVVEAINLYKPKLFVQRSIKQLIFEGYEDILMELAVFVNSDLSMYNGRFAYLYGRNATDDGLYTVFTGETGSDKINVIDKLNGLSDLPFWPKSECSNLNMSTNGEFKPPIMDDSEPAHIYHPDFCRTFKLNYEKTHKIIEGMTVKRYVPDENNFKNANDYFPNSCYIPNEPSVNVENDTDPDYSRIMYPSGVFDISSCKYGAPVLLSYPHFLDADPYYLSTVIGLRPNRSKHNFYLDIEPLTGMTAQISAKIQVNIAINKPKHLTQFKNVPEIVFPVFWQNLDSVSTVDLAKLLYWVGMLPSVFPCILGYILVIVGSTIMFFAGRLYMNERRIKKLKINNDTNNNMEANNIEANNNAEINSRISGRVQNGSTIVAFENPLAS